MPLADEDRATSIEALPPGLLEGMHDLACYGEAAISSDSTPPSVEEIQTHISHVFLVGDRVYKLRKPVDLGFLCFATRKQRNVDCLNEVRLNRRLSEDVYLGVVALEETSAGWRAGPLDPLREPAPTLPENREHCVVMRRLPAGRSSLDLLALGEFGPAHIDALAERLVAFHAEQSLGAPAPYPRDGWLDRVYGPMQTTLDLLRDARCAELPGAVIDAMEMEIRAWFQDASESIEARRREGRIVEGHGDIHLDHVWFESGADRPTIVDCLEFDAELRRIDVAGELAFLAMDLRYRERADLAERLLRRYAAATDDFGLYSIVDFHIVHRALVRASVAGIATAEPEMDDEQRRAAGRSAGAHLELARSLLAEAPRSALLLVTGTVGSGKSTVAEDLAERIRGVLVSSDATRKRLAGLVPEARAGGVTDAGIYDPEWTRRTYAALLERAAPALDSGRPVILDATWSTREQRDVARRWAEARGVPSYLVHTRCAPAVARERLRAREASGRGASDAGPRFLEESLRRYESPDEWVDELRIDVDTDREDWPERLAEALESRKLAPDAGREGV